MSLFSELDSHASYRNANWVPGSSQASVRSLSGVRGDCDVGRLGDEARARCLTRLSHFGGRGSSYFIHAPVGSAASSAGGSSSQCHVKEKY